MKKRFWISMILSLIAAAGFIYMVAVRGETERWIGAVGTSFAAIIAVGRYVSWKRRRLSKYAGRASSGPY